MEGKEELNTVAIHDDWSTPHVLYTMYSGIVTGEELLQTALKKSGDPRLDDVLFIIGDWTQSTLSFISAEEVKELVAYLSAISKTCPKAKNATIVKRDNNGNALAAWYKLLADKLPWETEIFHTLDAAEAWIGTSIPRRLLNEQEALRAGYQADVDAPRDIPPAKSPRPISHQ